jgi:MFS transporter, ACS family, D-galactonate transporter
MAAPSYYVVWAIIVYAWVANYLIRMSLGSLLPPIMEELALSYTSAGFLSTGFFYAYMLMQVPAGYLGDRLGRKRMLVAGLVLSAVSSVLTGLAGSFVALFGARFLTGLSQGFLFSNDRVIIAATTPRDKMALGLGISFSGPGVGTTLGIFLAGALGAWMAWRNVFFVFALPPLSAAVLLWLFVPEPSRADAAADPAWPFRRVLRSRQFWLLGASAVMPVYAQFVLAVWGPLLFVEVGVRDLGRAAFLASFQGLMAPLGLLVSGLVADRMRSRGVGGGAIIASSTLLLTAALAAMGLAVSRHAAPAVLEAVMLVASFAIWCTWSPVFATLEGAFPPSVLGRAFGAFNTAAFLGGVVGPHLTGFLRDLTGSFAVPIYVMAALSLAGAATARSLPAASRPATVAAQ